MTPIEIMKSYKKGIFFILTLVLIENVAWIIEPTIFGDVIDSFISKNSANNQSAFAYLPLVIWISLFLINSGVGSLRRSLDQKVYLNIYNNIILKISDALDDTENSLSKVGIRAELSREYITFFQYRLPEILEQFISIFGALIALYYFDWRISATCLFVLIPLFIFNSLYNKNVLVLQKVFHDEQEEMFNVLKTRDKKIINNYFINLTKPQQKIANWGAVNFGFIRISLLIIFLVVMYISIDLDNFSTGDFYSIVAYIWTFISSAEYVPELMESWTSLSDISLRIKQDNNS